MSLLSILSMFLCTLVSSFLVKLSLTSPFNDRNFEQALDFVVNRAQEQVSFRSQYDFDIQVYFPALSGVTGEISKRFPNVQKSVIAAAVNAGNIVFSIYSPVVAARNVASRHGFKTDDLNCLKDYNGCLFKLNICTYLYFRPGMIAFIDLF